LYFYFIEDTKKSLHFSEFTSLLYYFSVRNKNYMLPRYGTHLNKNKKMYIITNDLRFGDIFDIKCIIILLLLFYYTYSQNNFLVLLLESKLV